MIDMTRTGVGTYRFAISGSDAFSLYDVGANVDRLIIDSSGNVGLGINSPTNYYSGADNLVVYQASGEAGITVATATDTTGALYFADGS